MRRRILSLERKAIPCQSGLDSFADAASLPDLTFAFPLMLDWNTNPHSPSTIRATLHRALVALALAALAPGARAEPEARLQIESRPGGFAFELTGSTGAGPWVLQHSLDGTAWDDILFMEDATGTPSLEIQLRVLPVPDAQTGLFRAVRLGGDDPFLRRFLEERSKWRLAGIDDYQYQLQQNFSIVSWRGTIKVMNEQVASFTTISLYPSFVSTPEIPTIDRLFERIADAIAQDAYEIRVTWHPTLGYPTTCYIDLEQFLADEESGWTIESFTPSQ
jgi:hypothetical protein